MPNKNQEVCPQLIKNAYELISIIRIKAKDSLVISWLKNPVIFMAFITLLLLLVRLFLRSSSLTLDEAEQIVLSQTLNPGYPYQPPLYTWLQYLVFQLTGYNLFGLVVLKYSLLLGCLYSYSLICQFYCLNTKLAAAAIFSWVLLIPVSLDLLKDNTHSLLALLAACLTWCWFTVFNQRNRIVSYIWFGIILSAGLLSKFNYLLFLILLLGPVLSIKEERSKVINWRILISLLIIVAATSPYLYWVKHHSQIALLGSYKLNATNTSIWSGPLEILKACAFLLGPFLIFAYSLFHFSAPVTAYHTKIDRLLLRYLLLCIPFLSILFFILGFEVFQPRWMIPLLWIAPVFYFHCLNQTLDWRQPVRKFILFCILIQSLLVVSLIVGDHYGSRLGKHDMLNLLTQDLQKNCAAPQDIYSSSHWLMGNLYLDFPDAAMHLITVANDFQASAMKKSNTLVIWDNNEKPGWVTEAANTGFTFKAGELKTPRGDVFAGYLCTQQGKP